MPMEFMQCPVLDYQVARVTDFEGHVIRVVCGEYDASSGTCHLRERAFEGGPLTQLLGRLTTDSLATRSTRCALLAA